MSSLELFAERYKNVTFVSQGPNGYVYQATDLLADRYVTIKEIEVGGRNKLSEAEAMGYLHQCPYTLDLIEVLESTNHVYLVTEATAKHIDLYKLLVSSLGPMSEQLSRHLFRQLILAVQSCHDSGIYHRDIKPDNILLCDQLKLTGFEHCVVTDPRKGPGSKMLKGRCGTPEYKAPEAVEGKLYNGEKADIWSCGLILYVLTTWSLPSDLEEMRLKIKRRSSPGLQRFLLRILDPNPATRMCMDEILMDRWFTEGLNEEENRSTSPSFSTLKRRIPRSVGLCY